MVLTKPAISQEVLQGLGVLQGHVYGTAPEIASPTSHHSVIWVTCYMLSGPAVQILTCTHHTPQGNHIFSQYKGLKNRQLLS